MPAILPAEKEKTWLRQELTKEEVNRLLIPYDSSLMDACALEKDYLKRT
jgi:putative SOS response-associated peptidase YedK